LVRTLTPLHIRAKETKNDDSPKTNVVVHHGPAAFAGGKRDRNLGLNQADPRKSDVAKLSAVLRHHQMADMMHDAIRADVLAALEAKSAKEQEEVNNDLKDHGETIQREMQANLDAKLPPALNSTVEKVRSQLAGYVQAAAEEIHLANTNRNAAEANLPHFMDQFKVLGDSREAAGTLIEHSKSQTLEGVVRQLMAMAEGNKLAAFTPEAVPVRPEIESEGTARRNQP
jgi:hypothetical protein